jgi:flagellar biosynthesis protein FlhF
MFVKTYRHQTLTGALRAAKAELGPDALVLSTATVHASGLRGLVGGREVEVTAAIERDAVPAARHRAPARRTPEDGSAGIAARLSACGLDPTLARAIAAAHPGERRRGPNQTLEDTVASYLAALTASDEPLAAVEVFVGPPGAGKTTTIAKIAARERTSRGRRLTLVAADGYRVGAVEQLRLYADILGTPLTVARTGLELDEAIARTSRPVLVDTPGRSPGDRLSRDLFERIGRTPGARTHLVIPAGMPPSMARRTVDRFAEARPTRVVVTKVDEVESLAPLMGVLQESSLPISFVGTGQRVPEDLQRATPPALAAWVLGTHLDAGAVEGATA